MLLEFIESNKTQYYNIVDLERLEENWQRWFVVPNTRWVLVLIGLGNWELKKNNFYLKVYYEKNLIIQWNKMYNLSGKN